MKDVMLNDILLYIQDALLIPITIFGCVTLEAFCSCLMKFEDVSYHNYLKRRLLMLTLLVSFLIFLYILINIYKN